MRFPLYDFELSQDADGKRRTCNDSFCPRAWHLAFVCSFSHWSVPPTCSATLHSVNAEGDILSSMTSLEIRCHWPKLGPDR